MQTFVINSFAYPRQYNVTKKREIDKNQRKQEHVVNQRSISKDKATAKSHSVTTDYKTCLLQTDTKYMAETLHRSYFVLELFRNCNSERKLLVQHIKLIKFS